MSWNRFFLQFQKDLKLWLYGVAYLEVYRLVLILYFHRRLDAASGWAEITRAMLNGFRYDTVVAAYWMVLPLLAGVACGFADWSGFADRLRRAIGVTYVVVSTLLFTVALGYYREFDDVFNEYIFGIYYDDTRAVLATIASEFHLVPIILGSLGVMALGIVLVLRLLSRAFVVERTFGRFLSSWPRKVAASVVIALFVTVAIRGSFGHRPAQRQTAAVTTDPFLNKAILNPFMSLKYALQDHRVLSRAQGVEVYLPDGDVRSAARYLFPTADTGAADLDGYLLKHAAGPKTVPPRHIFLIMEESFGAWALMDRYAPLRLNENLKALAEDGLAWDRFLPASGGTMLSLAAIITGLADAGVHTSHQPLARAPFPSSVTTSFKALHYTTRLFYGGYLSWQRIGDFARAQGFDEVYGAAHIDRWTDANEWGLNDRYLFDFVGETVIDDRPSFNIVLTITYHPPYNIDVRGAGFPLTAMPPELDSLWDHSVDLNNLGHLWYADRCLGDGVRGLARRLPQSLFAITGDHAPRKLLNAHPDFFEKSAVPFVLYGPDILSGLTVPRDAAGSHLDIVPTLIELTAPEGFPYYSLGRDLLSRRPRSVGFGRGKAIGPGFIAGLNGDPILHPLPGSGFSEPLFDPAELQREHDALHGVAWWRIVRGPAFPEITIGRN